mmetsp:Transcript_7297/g.13257  ORF Transcript_7297/g.13257 Transcript_7297/m.13257 type:complete len:101 (-) Transcript_7297:2122-2424(-)
MLSPTRMVISYNYNGDPQYTKTKGGSIWVSENPSTIVADSSKPMWIQYAWGFWRPIECFVNTIKQQFGATAKCTPLILFKQTAFRGIYCSSKDCIIDDIK